MKRKYDTNINRKIKLNELRIEYEDKCKNCSATENLEFAHIKETKVNGRGRGRNRRMYDILKNPEAYNLLCERCHTDYDNNKIQMDHSSKEGTMNNMRTVPNGMILKILGIIKAMILFVIALIFSIPVILSS